ncbi:MAG: hypothetical protein ACPGYV_09540 [Phycisphaeraceae bacterium]
MIASKRHQQSLSRVAAGLLLTVGLTGCSAFQESHVLEPEPAVSPQALATADGFVAAPFSLVAADSVGFATFGQEIAHWDDLQRDEQLAAKR